MRLVFLALKEIEVRAAGFSIPFVEIFTFNIKLSVEPGATLSPIVNACEVEAVFISFWTLDRSAGFIPKRT